MTQDNPHNAKWYGSNRRVRIGMILGSLGVLVAVMAIRYYWDADSAHAQTTADRSTARSTNAASTEDPKAATTARAKLDLVATVNGEKISREDLARECLRHYGKEVLESLVNKCLIRQECERQGLVVTEKEVSDEVERMAKRFGLPIEQWYKMLKQERGINPAQYASDIIWPMLALRKLAGERLKVTPAELEEAYETQFGPAVKARLIAVKDLDKAKELHAKAVADPGQFGNLAKKYSEDTPSASDNGCIPQIHKNAGHKEIEQVAFSMKDGEISPVIQVAGQCVILKREEGIPARNVDREKVTPRLEKMIEERKLHVVAHDVFRELQSRAKLEDYFNSNDPAKRDSGVALVLNGHNLTVRELAEECITRHGEEVLEGTINRRLLEQACKKQGVQVTKEDEDAEIRRAAAVSVAPKPDGSPDVEAWLKQATKDQGISETVYRHDSVWPSVALRKLANGDVQITEEDIDKGFEANYGPRVRCLAIVLDDLRRAQEVWALARKDPSPKNFGDLAEQYSIEAGSKKLRGEVPPIQKHRGQPVLEKEAFALAAGELSGIIQADDKFVILFCEGRTDPIQVDKTAVRKLLEDYIREEKLRIAMSKCFQQLQDHAAIDNYLAGTSQEPKNRIKPATSVPTLRQVPATHR